MKLSDRGLLEIAEHEGIVLGPYKDSRGIWTYGVGHTAGAGEPRPADMPHEDTRGWSDDRAKEEMLAALVVFDNDLDRFEARVNGAIHVKLAQHQFDALVSFDFNTGGIDRAQLTRAINTDDPDAARHFMGWTKPASIIPRRKAEQALFRTGNYSANGDAIPIYNAHGDGRFSRRGLINSGDLLDMMAGAKHTPPPAPQPPLVLIPSAPVWSPLTSIIRAIMAIFRRA